MQSSGWSRAGMVLTRIVVPLWILTGALFKLYERNPGNLPVIIRDSAKQLFEPGVTGWFIILRTLIGLELFAVAVMILVPRLSRAMAIFMLTSFCAILAGDMVKNATSCGCFGSLPVKPWHMLLIDGSLLLGVVVTWVMSHPIPVAAARENGPSLLKPALAMIPLMVLGLGAGFMVPERAVIEQPVVPGTMPTSQPTTMAATKPAPAADPTINPTPRGIPGNWVTPNDVEAAWVGKPWRDMELFQFMQRWPKDIDKGTHYVVFYGRTCDHCHEMFEVDLFRPLDAPVSVVEVPFSRTEMRAADAWEMPQTAPLEHLELPLGCSYVMTTPLALRIEDGKITCAQEGGHKKCLGLE